MIDLVEGRRPGFAWAPKFRLLTQDLTPFTLPNPPVPGDASDVSPWVHAASISWSAAADVQRTITVEFNSAIGTQVNLNNVYLQPFRCYYDAPDANGHRQLLAEMPRGVFMFVVDQRELRDTLGRYKLTGNERTWRIKNCGFQNQYTIPQGFDAVEAAKILCMMDKLTPSEGGRQPSGVAAPSGPHASLPTGTNQYCTAGTPVTTASTGGTPWTVGGDGLILSFSGLFTYNPLGGALVNAVTEFPIDPWTCRDMTFPMKGGMPFVSYPDTCQASNGLFYNTRTGAFYAAWYPDGFATKPIDPFTGQYLPAGVSYFAPNPADPSQTLGTVKCPLATFPSDYSGGGPYAGTGGSAQTTTSGGSSSTTTTGPTSMSILFGQGFATRYGSGLTTVVPTGSYGLGAPVCAADPSNPGKQWCQPAAAGTGPADSVDVTGYAWAGGTWTIGLDMTGLASPQGSLSISATLYEKLANGTKTLRGTFPAGSAVSFAATPNATVMPTCSATVGAFSPADGSVLEVDITVQVLSTLTISPDGVNTFSGGFAPGLVTLTYPAPSITTVTTTPDTVSGGNAIVTPTVSGTVVPWPDVSNCGETPSGCEDAGPNLPASQIVTDADPAPLAVTTSYGRKDNKLAAVDALLTIANCYPVTTDSQGILQMLRQPFTSSLLPTAEYRLVTKADGILQWPVNQRLMDPNLFANRIIVEGQNSNSTPVVAMEINNSVNSAISITNLGYDIFLYISDNSITDQATAQLRAFVEVLKRAIAQNSLELLTVALPLEGNDVLDVQVTTDGVAHVGDLSAATTLAVPAVPVGHEAELKQTIQLTDPAPFAVGDSIEIGTDPYREQKTINVLSGAVATLSSPLAFPHDAGEPVQTFDTPFIVGAYTEDMFAITTMKITAGKAVAL